jgi:hypothetical protein
MEIQNLNHHIEQIVQMYHKHRKSNKIPSGCCKQLLEQFFESACNQEHEYEEELIQVAFVFLDALSDGIKKKAKAMDFPVDDIYNQLAKKPVNNNFIMTVAIGTIPICKN